MEQKLSLTRRRNERTKQGLMMIKVMEDLLLRMLCLGLDILLGLVLLGLVVSLLIVLLGLDISLKLEMRPVQLVCTRYSDRRVLKFMMMSA